MPDDDIGQLVKDLLAGKIYEAPSSPEDFEVAVGRLVHDGMERHTAETLMEKAQGRGQNLLTWSDQILRSRAEYRRKLPPEVRS